MTNNSSIINPDKEKELIFKAQQGDLQAFEELIKVYQTKVYNFAYYIAGNHTDAEDLFQEAFLKVYRNIRQFRADSSFNTWLYSVCKNTFINEIKKKRRTKQEIHFDDNWMKNEMTHPLSKKMYDNQTEQKRSQIAAEQILNEIPLKFRIPIILFDLQGYNYKEIAEMLKTTVAAIRCRLSKGRKILKKKFKESEIF